MIFSEAMATLPPKYANVAPKVAGRERQPSVCESCKCANCYDNESCSNCSVVDGGYLRTVPGEKPPVPCRQRKFTDDFSPEECFRESMIERDTPKHDTKRMKELDIPLPLPSEKSRDSVFLNPPPSNLPPPVFPRPEPSIQRYIQRHPTQLPWHTEIGQPSKQIHRKPSDDLPVPKETQPPLLVPEQTQKTEDDRLSPFDTCITLPRRKSELRKRRKRAPRKVQTWMKWGTIVSVVLFIGLSYMIVKSIKDIFFVSRHHRSPPQQIRNYSEPNESKLDTTICFSCDVIDKFKGQESKFKLYGFRSVDNRVHCCLDQLGHLKWLVSMMKTNEILQTEERSNNTNKICSVKTTIVPIVNGDKTELKLDSTGLKKQCKGASINVTDRAIVTRKDGLHIVYMTMSVDLASGQTNGDENKVLKAHLYCSKSKKGKCLEMETFNKTISYSESNYHVFNLYTVKKFTHGEHIFPGLSKPKYLYKMQYANFIGVVEL